MGNRLLHFASRSRKISGSVSDWPLIIYKKYFYHPFKNVSGKIGVNGGSQSYQLSLSWSTSEIMCPALRATFFKGRRAFGALLGLPDSADKNTGHPVSDKQQILFHISMSQILHRTCSYQKIIHCLPEIQV